MSAIGNLIINLMARTEAFVKDMTKAQNKVTSFQKTAKGLQSALNTGMKFAGMTLLADNLMDTATKIQDSAYKGSSAAQKWGSDMLDMIPIVGTLNKKFEDLFDNIAGVSVNMERLKLAAKFEGRADEIEKMITETNTLSKLSEFDKEKYKAAKEYEEELNKINQYRTALVASQEMSPISAAKEAAELRLLADETYQNKLKQIQAKETELINKENEQKQIDIERKKAEINKENDRLLKEQESFKKSVENLVDSLMTPLEMATKEAENAIKLLDDALSKNVISLDDYMKSYNRVTEKFNDSIKKVEESNINTPNQLDFKQFDPNLLSVSGLSFRSGIDTYQKQTAENTKKIAQNTENKNGATL